MTDQSNASVKPGADEFPKSALRERVEGVTSFRFRANQLTVISDSTGWEIDRYRHLLNEHSDVKLPSGVLTAVSRDLRRALAERSELPFQFGQPNRHQEESR